jgi:hypothetical protein
MHSSIVTIAVQGQLSRRGLVTRQHIGFNGLVAACLACFQVLAHSAAAPYVAWCGTVHWLLRMWLFLALHGLCGHTADGFGCWCLLPTAPSQGASCERLLLVVIQAVLAAQAIPVSSGYEISVDLAVWRCRSGWE